MNSVRKLPVVLGAAGVTLLAVLLFVVNPAATTLFPPCLWHTLTGLYCPGCGSTRALHQLLHGHWTAACRLNPLMVATLPLLGVLLVKREPLALRAGWIWTLLAIIVTFGVLRNIPQYPFTLLAP